MKDIKINVEDTIRFLRFLGNDDAPFTFAHMNDAAERKIVRTLHGKFSDLKNRLIHLNSMKEGIYVTINPTDGHGRKTNNVLGTRNIIFSDFDSAPPPETLAPTCIVNSKRGPHFYWRINEPVERDEFSTLQSKLSNAYGSDPKVKDLPRIMRLPGFYHWKDPDSPFLVNIQALNNGVSHSKAAVLNLVSLRKKSDVIREGGRNDSVFQTGRDLRSLGLTPEMLKEKMHEVNNTLCKPPMADSEVESIIKSVLKSERPLKEYTDSFAAEKFRDFSDKRFKFVTEWKKWICWNGESWAVDQSKQTYLEIQRMNQALLGQHEANIDINNIKQFRAFKKSLEKESNMKSLLSVAEAHMSLSSDSLDKDDHLLNVKNGILNLKTGELLNHSPDLLMTNQVEIPFDRDAKCPNWIEALNCWCNADAELVYFLQKAVGYSLSGFTGEEVMFMLLGPGANGKTTFAEVLRLLSYTKQAAFSTFVVRSSDNVRNDIARLQNCRIVSASESAQGRALDEALIKQLTGRDRIAARYLFKEHFEFVPKFKIWFLTNHKLRIKGQDEGIWRRIRLIPFDAVVPVEKRDRNLIEKLKRELPGILRWAVDGFQAWQREGLGECRRVTEASGEYRTEEDIFAEFFQTKYELVSSAALPSGDKITTQSVRERFLDFCRGNGLNPWSPSEIKESLERLGCIYRRTNKQRFWVNVKHRENNSDY